jgi:hypothetical protein
VGITPERSARITTSSSAQRGSAARPRSNSTSSLNYREGGGTNLIEQFDNTSASRASAARRTPALNTEQRTFLERTLQNQGLDPTNLSPVNQQVVYIGGLTPVKIFLRLRLQNLFPGVCPPMVAECKWLAVVLWCACLRVEVMVSMSARCSKGGGHGFNVARHV